MPGDIYIGTLFACKWSSYIFTYASECLISINEIIIKLQMELVLIGNECTEKKVKTDLR